MKCVFCGKEIPDVESCNASPFRGRCCHECDDNIVIRARMLHLYPISAVCFDIENKIIKRYNAQVYSKESIQSMLNSTNVDAICSIEAYGEKFIVFATTDKRQMKMNKMFNQLFEKQCNPLKGNVLLVNELYLI